MTVKPQKFLLAFIFVLTFCFLVNGQDNASTRDGRPDPNKPDLPVGIQETLAKSRLKRAEKEYQDLLERSEEAAKLGEELSKVLESGQKFSSDDKKKLERLEKIIKRIRTDLGGKDDSPTESETGENFNFKSAIKNIQKDTANLLGEIKKIGRHTISVIAIESSNSVLKLIRFLRFNSN